jgi:hypothetical protein
MGPLRYVLEVYVDNFISAITPTSKEQIKHVARGILHGIHDVFPPSKDDERDPISLEKLKKGKGTYDTTKCLLGFDFDGVNKTMWLEESKHAALLTILHQWIRGATKAGRGIPFADFESVTAKSRHAFTALREGRGLLSPCNWVIRKRPPIVYLHRNVPLLEAIRDIRTILQVSVKHPTKCKDLVAGWPDYIGIVDASSHGVGGLSWGSCCQFRRLYFVCSGRQTLQTTWSHSKTRGGGSQIPTSRWRGCSFCGSTWRELHRIWHINTSPCLAIIHQV